jgi:hypothetical protein
LIVAMEAVVASFQPGASDFHVAEKLDLGGVGHMGGRGGPQSQTGPKRGVSMWDVPWGIV